MLITSISAFLAAEVLETFLPDPIYAATNFNNDFQRKILLKAFSHKDRS